MVDAIMDGLKAPSPQSCKTGIMLSKFFRWLMCGLAGSWMVYASPVDSDLSKESSISNSKDANSTMEAVQQEWPPAMFHSRDRSHGEGEHQPLLLQPQASKSTINYYIYDCERDESVLVPLGPVATTLGNEYGGFEGRTGDPPLFDLIWQTKVRMPLVILSNAAIFALGFWLGGRH